MASNVKFCGHENDIMVMVCKLVICAKWILYLVEASSEAGLFGGSVNYSIVEPPQRLAGHSLECPRTQTHVLGPDLQLHHVVRVNSTLS